MKTKGKGKYSNKVREILNNEENDGISMTENLTSTLNPVSTINLSSSIASLNNINLILASSNNRNALLSSSSSNYVNSLSNNIDSSSSSLNNINASSSIAPANDNSTSALSDSINGATTSPNDLMFSSQKFSSNVWLYATKSDDGCIARCNLCDYTCSSKSHSTSTIRYHLIHKHKKHDLVINQSSSTSTPKIRERF